jgi:hypothetical protein
MRLPSLNPRMSLSRSTSAVPSTQTLPADRHPGQAMREPGSQKSGRLNTLRSRIRLRLSGMTSGAIGWRTLRNTRALSAAALAALLAGAGTAPLCAAPQDTSACGAFAWSVAREIKLFGEAGIEPVMSGATLLALPATGVALELQPDVTVDYVLPPGREQNAGDSYGGILSIATLEKPGAYQVTASEGAWLDAIQNGRALAPAAQSGNEGCPGVRKSVRFDFEAGPLTIQLSGAASMQIKIAILPAE